MRKLEETLISFRIYLSYYYQNIVVLAPAQIKQITETKQSLEIGPHIFRQPGFNKSTRAGDEGLALR